MQKNLPSVKSLLPPLRPAPTPNYLFNEFHLQKVFTVWYLFNRYIKPRQEQTRQLK
jgi:hypothetical protein